MTPIVTVYAVFGSHEQAERTGTVVVEERLAACVNILAPCQSIYRWQDRVERATEVPALFKTTAANADKLVARIAALHDYDTPAIMVWPITHAPDSYSHWVEAETGD